MVDRTDSKLMPEPGDFPKPGMPADAETPSSATEASVPMLEVHAPHEGIHTWRDFFIHKATIAIGLLIAIGLEQTVEWLHHRHQLREAREEISGELQRNRLILQQNIEHLQETQAELDRDMSLLRDYRSLHKPMNAMLDYSWKFRRTPDAAWQAVKQNGSMDLMPYEELEIDNFLYTVFGNVMDAAEITLQADFGGAGCPSTSQYNPSAHPWPRRWG
jgi:hypothetical protein